MSHLSENIVETFEKLVRVLVGSKQQNAIPTEEEIKASAEEARVIRPVSAEIFNHILRKLHTEMRVSMDTGIAIVGNAPHQSWLPGRKASMDSYYWDRYKLHLELHNRWNGRVISTLGTVTNEILDLLGDPMNTAGWQRRGLVLGDVQSGKTATYAALCNKAMDAGYRVIILLTGTQENLRRQTQKRLDEDLVGEDSRQAFSKEVRRSNVVGVGRINFVRKAATFTSILRDFSSVFLNNNNMRIKEYNEPVLFVVKKNKKILENLENWLRTHNADPNGIIDLPLLLVDDEADNASVNTREENNPTAINEAIRKLLALFNRASYVGVTATPFANIFIHPDTNDSMLGDNLFPRDFIYSLTPPTNYIGNNAMFGSDPTHGGALIPIRDAERIFPYKHKSVHPVEDLPESLWEALRYFLLTNVVRDIRKHDRKHRSMMVNVSRFTAVQDQTAMIIQNWLDRVQNDVFNYSKFSVEDASRVPSIRALRETWDKHGFTELCETGWEQVQQEMLRDAIMPIVVKSVNQRTGAASLDYEAHRESGLRVIAVGGNSLSRGLTLEGLSVSYFYRNSQMYDTLMQMGRWFGYRDGYEDLCRVWMSDGAMNWYSHITEASNELRGEVRRMKRFNMTPSDFGLKVREHPESLIVTARNKMKNSRSVVRWISVSGKLLETPKLQNNDKVLMDNFDATIQFVHKLDVLGRRIPNSTTKLLWTDVPKKEIADFIREFMAHPLHMPFQSDDIASYIETSDHLSTWDVAIPEGNGEEFVFGEFRINKQERTVSLDRGTILVNGRSARVGSRGCTKAGLEKSRIKELEESYKEENGDKNPSDDLYLTRDRKPLLLLHFIEPKGEEASKIQLGQNSLVAVGVGFPNFGGNKKVKYALNLVEVRQMFESEEDDDNNDDD